jgi:hypothetical protein
MLSMGFSVLVSPRLRCHPSYGVLTVAPTGLSPAERASLSWTHSKSVPFLKLQGYGIGGELMAFAESKARENGYAEVRLTTQVLLDESISLYRHPGREATGRSEFNVFMKKMIRAGNARLCRQAPRACGQ